MTGPAFTDLADSLREPDSLTILLAGDLVLDADDPDHWLSGIAPAVRAADIAIGHLEVPHTRRGTETGSDVPASPAAPEHLDALARAGFTAVSLAGNHIADFGPEGIADTIARLDELGIAHAGAGPTLAAARRAAVLKFRDWRIALLSYNCVGPESGWATRDRPGCSYLRIATANGAPVAPMAELTTVTDEALWWLTDDIVAAGDIADLVIVSLHKGIVHTPAVLAPYEQQLATAALAAGADIVVGHHAHIVRGVELRRGRPIFHGLGNACVVTHALDPGQDHPARRAWAEKRRQLFGFDPDPRYPLAPFHPEAVNGLLGIVVAAADRSLATGILPLFVEPPGRPVCAGGERGERVVAYLKRIGAAAGLPRQDWRRHSDYLWMNEK